jgi:phosphotransferase system HPr (HPr) family protein
MVAWGSGFVMLYLYGQDWFMDFAVFGVNMRELFHLHPVNLSVAVWVGFLALFGIAVDDGVVMHTYIEQRLAADRPRTRADVRASVRACIIEAGLRRIRPCLMTTATTLLALLPILTSTGRGADLLLPMALPIIGGITLGVFDWFTVPSGVHLRVAAEIVKKVQQHQSAVQVTCEGGATASASSIMQLLSLGAEKGTPLQVTIEGLDEEATLQDLSELFEDGAGI